jgi:outer membrane protein insertion porin family
LFSASAKLWRLGLLLLVLGLFPGSGPRPDQAWAAEPEQEQAGPTVVLRFQGNTALGEARLRAAAAEDLAAFSRLGRRPAIDDAAYLMQLAYRRAGYHFAEVEYRLESTAEAHQVDFLVHEGPRVLVGALEFRGNTVFTDRELTALVENALRGENGTGPLPFVESRLNQAVGLIRELYLNEGYRDIGIEIGEWRFTPEEPQQAAQARVDIPISLSEGLRQVIVAVQLADEPPAGAAAAIDRALLAAEAELTGQPYFTRRKLVLRSRLLEAFHQTGYPEARVQVDDLPGEKPGEIILQAELASGPLVEIAEIEIQGNQHVSSRFIRQRLAFKPGDIYRDSARRQSFNELYRSRLFTRIDLSLAPLDDPAEPPPAILPDEDQPVKRKLLVRVDEAGSRELFLAGGWGSYEMLRLRAGFTNRNLFGHGRVFRLETGGSLKGAEVLAGITDPWLLESRISADFPLYYRVREEPSFTRSELGLGALFSRDLRQAMTASLGYQIRRSNIGKIEADIASESLESSYNIASIKFQLSRDTRDDIFFPSRGQRAYGAVETADAVLGSDLAFYRFTGGLRRFIPLSPLYTLGLRADTGLILPGRDQITIPLGERFFNGGERSVRSFREGQLGPKDLDNQPVGGMAFNILSIELRRRLGENLAVSLFADYGNLAPNLSRAEEGKEAAESRSEVIRATMSDYLKDFRPALGVGFQYLLPVGPARLDFAFNPDRRPDRHEPDFVVHFSLGMAF